MDSREAYQCVWCGSLEYKLIKSFYDLVYFWCFKCDSIYSYPKLSKLEMKAYYTRWYHFEHQLEVGHPIITERINHDLLIASIRIGEIFQIGYTPKTANEFAVLDVGCSNGAFLKKASELGFKADGIEVDKDIIEIAQKVVYPLDVRIYNGLFEDIELGQYDIIVLNDVIEHFCDPLIAIGKLVDITKQLLVIESPNTNQCKRLWHAGGEITDWKHFRYKEHLNIPSPQTLEDIFNKRGFNKIKLIEPIEGRFGLYLKN